MDTTDRLDTEFDHEKVTIFRDPETSACGAIAIHSTALGPAMGGLRLFGYPSLAATVLDALRLSRAMSLKNSAAGLDLGGGKAVLFDDGAWSEQRPRRMRAVGRIIDELGGSYVTAEDVGTAPEDMNAIADVTSHVAGCSTDRGGRGDPSPATARTTFSAIASAAERRLGREDLDGVRVGVQGVGRVGSRLAALLAAAGAVVDVADVDADRAAAVAAECGATQLPVDGFMLRDFDVFSPCAMGGAVTVDSVSELRCTVIAGAANNQLADRATAVGLAARDILYVPDFLSNCGGIIHVGAEVLGLTDDQVEDLIRAAIERTGRTLDRAADSERIPLDIAVETAQRRLDAGRGAVAESRALQP